MARVDFEISGGGTVYLLHPLTRAAHSWIAEHLPADAMRLGDAVAVEWRFIRDVVGGAIRRRAAGAVMAHPKDYLGRPLHVGDVVVYAILVGSLGGGQPLRRGVILGLQDSYAWIRMQPRSAQGRPATARIHHDRVLVMPDALPARQAAQLRAHVVRPRPPRERTQRRELPPRGRLAVAQRALVTVPITPGQTLAAAGIDDARQAEYQRKMSALLASRS